MLLVFGLLVTAAVAVAQIPSDPTTHGGLGVVLLLAAVASGLAVTQTHGRGSITAAFIVVLLAAALLGPTWACALAAVTEIAASLKVRTPRYAVAFNLLAACAPALIAANLIRELAPHTHQSLGFYVLVAGAGVVDLVLNISIVIPYQHLFRGDRSWTLRTWLELTPSFALNIALAVAGAAIYLKVGLAGITFALTAVFAFTYMAHLLSQSRHRAEQYVSLSWGVLAGLMRSLDTRDQRAARHAAAVARFARDMARSVGMSETEQELAHTAGLLHDIGHFALSDRVAERGKTLSEEDWVAIQRHPQLGADMLRDLGMYGPVAEIVLSHHERLDGRGYPRGLSDNGDPGDRQR